MHQQHHELQQELQQDQELQPQLLTQQQPTLQSYSDTSPTPAPSQLNTTRTIANYLSSITKKKWSVQPSCSDNELTSSNQIPPPPPPAAEPQVYSPTLSSTSVIDTAAPIGKETQNSVHFGVMSCPMPLSRSHRGSISTPCIPIPNDSESTGQINTSTLSSHLPPPSFLPHTTGTKKSARDLISRAVGFGQGRSVANETLLQFPVVTNDMLPKASIASYAANEVLSLIFRNLMDRKSILNCSLVSIHWHGPARAELVRITQDMPFNGQGLVHAIRARFAGDTFPFLSMAVFDKLVCNLSELYYHSNPETKEVFAPVNAPDMLYHLFWTFLFIDQEFRNPRTRPKVTCNYFVRLLQNEGGGYPRHFFDKKTLKNIYNDIRSRPLLPSPHLIRALQGVEGSNGNEVEGTSSRTRDTRPTMYRRQSSFMNLANSIKLEEPFKRVKKWWRNVRDEGEQNQVGWVSHLDSSEILSSYDSQQDTGVLTDASVSYQAQLEASSPTNSFQTPQSGSSVPIQDIPSPGRSLRSRFGAKSDLAINKSSLDVGSSHLRSSPILSQGFTTVAYGWHPEGDGLDDVVCFPKAKGPSTLGAQHQILQCSELLLEMDTET